MSTSAPAPGGRARAVGGVMMTRKTRRRGGVRAAVALATALLLAIWGSARAETQSPALAALIKGAAAEGKIDLQWSSSLLGGLDGVSQAVDGMNKMFGLHLEPRLTPDPDSVPQLLNKVAVTQKAGQPSPTDAFVGTTVHIATAIQRDMVQGADWTALLPGRITESTIEDKGLAVRVFTTLPGGIVYNTQLAPHPPTSLADLLKPEWKGKIASNPYGASFELLSASDVWGEEKAIDFVRKFSAQISGLIGCPDMERVASGEFVLHRAVRLRGAALLLHGHPEERGAPQCRQALRHLPADARRAEDPLEDRRLRSAHFPGFGYASSDRGLRSKGREVPRIHARLVGAASGSGSGAA
jgi:hypothetical protein